MFYISGCYLIKRKVFVRGILFFLTCTRRLNTCVFHAEAAFLDFWKRSLSPTGRFALVLYARWCVQCITRSSFVVDRDSSGGPKRAASSTAALVPGLTEPVLSSRSKYTESFSLEVWVGPNRLSLPQLRVVYKRSAAFAQRRSAFARQLKCTLHNRTGTRSSPNMEWCSPTYSSCCLSCTRAARSHRTRLPFTCRLSRASRSERAPTRTRRILRRPASRCPSSTGCTRSPSIWVQVASLGATCRAPSTPSRSLRTFAHSHSFAICWPRCIPRSSCSALRSLAMQMLAQLQLVSCARDLPREVDERRLAGYLLACRNLCAPHTPPGQTAPAPAPEDELDACIQRSDWRRLIELLPSRSTHELLRVQRQVSLFVTQLKWCASVLFYFPSFAPLIEASYS